MRKGYATSFEQYNYFDLINGFESMLLKQGTPNKEYDDVYFEDFKDLFFFDMKLKKYTLAKIFDVESRLRNSEIHPKDLVDKLLQILTNKDLKFSEYIRNYSNKINEKRIKYLEKIGIDMKEISNIHLSHESNNILTDFLIKTFSSL